jgi:hypothetical protein
MGLEVTEMRKNQNQLVEGMKTQVTMRDVLMWIVAALDAARGRGDEDGTVTALSYRKLDVTMGVNPTWPHVIVITGNRAFSGDSRRVHTRTTSDGVEVVWWEEDRGIPTGADWLPEGFISWMKGGENG